MRSFAKKTESNAASGLTQHRGVGNISPCWKGIALVMSLLCVRYGNNVWFNVMPKGLTTMRARKHQ